MPVIDHCRSVLQSLQDHVEWTTERCDEPQVTLLKTLHVRRRRLCWFQISLADIRRSHDTAENVVRHVRARIVCASDRLCNVVSRQKSQQIANQENGTVSKTVG